MTEKQYDPDEIRDVIEVLEADFPTYEALLEAAAKMHIDQLEQNHKWGLLNWMLHWEGPSIEELKAFFERANLGKEPLEILSLVPRRDAQSKGATGGKSKGAKYQAIEAEIAHAYQSDSAAQAAKTIDHATHVFLKNHPSFDGRVGFRTIRDVISLQRK